MKSWYGVKPLYAPNEFAGFGAIARPRAYPAADAGEAERKFKERWLSYDAVPCQVWKLNDSQIAQYRNHQTLIPPADPTGHRSHIVLEARCDALLEAESVA